jgi:hypothetical protein
MLLTFPRASNSKLIQCNIFLILLARVKVNDSLLTLYCGLGFSASFREADTSVTSRSKAQLGLILACLHVQRAVQLLTFD